MEEMKMKMNPLSFGIASAITATVLWIICSFIVYVLPRSVMDISGHMMHTDLSEITWVLSIYGVLIGLVAWALFAGVFGWLLAFTYNLLDRE